MATVKAPASPSICVGLWGRPSLAWSCCAVSCTPRSGEFREARINCRGWSRRDLCCTVSKGSSHGDGCLEALISEQGRAEDAPSHTCLWGSLRANRANRERESQTQDMLILP